MVGKDGDVFRSFAFPFPDLWRPLASNSPFFHEVLHCEKLFFFCASSPRCAFERHFGQVLADLHASEYTAPPHSLLTSFSYYFAVVLSRVHAMVP